jgi:hypothetical protein
MAGQQVDLDQYTTQFDELKSESRLEILNLGSINPLSELREDWQNATADTSEHILSTQPNTAETAYLETDGRGEYASGYSAQMGTGVRIPKTPSGGSILRFGYYEVDANNDPLNGYYFGIDSEDIFVARARSGEIEKVYRSDWNEDSLDGTGPSGATLDFADGVVSQLDFVYYGYGSIEMKFLLEDDHKNLTQRSNPVIGHVFNVDGETSIENTNLPLRQDIVSDGSDTDGLELYVGGRQFSIFGQRNDTSRIAIGRNLSLAVDSTQWYPAVSFKLKDGSDIGTIDFSHIVGNILNFLVNVDTGSYEWQIRRGTQLSGATWQNPWSATDKQDETALKTDTSATSITDGNGNLTGVFIDGGSLSAGKKNEKDLQEAPADGDIVNDEIITLVFRGVSSSGTLSDIYFKMREQW